VELAGLTLKTPDAPDGDIEIRITGLQAGEKLYEELQIGNDISETSHDRIMRAQEFYVERKEIARLTTTLATLSIDQRNAKLFQIATLDDNKRRSSLH
jgi:FlaA1/EpsC-like NDP-sugar epimerase